MKLSKIILMYLAGVFLLAAAPSGSIRGQRKPDKPLRILIDASKDGGLWWFPQGQPFDAAQYHQGKPLADSLRRDGADVIELARGEVITADKLNEADVIIRVPAYFTYTKSEILAYQESVMSGARLLLVGAGTGNTDAVAQIFGLRFETHTRFASVQKWYQHPFTTDIERYTLPWSSVVEAPKEAVLLAWLSEGESNPRPVIGYLPFGRGYVVFVGQTLIFPHPDRSFSANLINSLGRYSHEELKQVISSEVLFAEEVEGTMPRLIEPSANSILPQPEAGEWQFDWEEVPEAENYEIVILGPSASFPLVQDSISKSEYTVEIRRGSYIAGHNLKGWSWRVRALYKNGAWGPWSRVRRFNIKPQNQ